MRIQLVPRASERRVLTYDNFFVEGLDLPVESVNILVNAGEVATATIKYYITPDEIPSIMQTLRGLAISGCVIENRDGQPTYMTITAPLAYDEQEQSKDKSLIRFFKTKGKKNAS